jgi:hypothetical protein
MNFLKKLTSMFNKSFFSKIVANFLLVAVLLVTTVSNPGDRLDLNTNNIDRDSFGSSTLIAAANRSETTYPTDDKNVGGLLYGDKNAESLKNKDDLIDPKIQDKLLDPTQIPAVKQPTINRTNPDNKLLEKTGQMFDDSGVLSNE